MDSNSASPPAPVYSALPAPSPLALPRAPLPSAPPAFAARCVLWLRTALQRLADRLGPPELALLEHSSGLGKTHVLAALARFGVPDALGDATLGAAEIARRTGLSPDILHRTLRALSAIGVFTLTSDGRFRNNRLSRALGRGQLSRGREWMLYFASGSNVAAWADFAHTLQSGASAFDRVHGMTVWDWFERHDDEREIFAHTMMGITLTEGPIIAGLYPFGEIQRLCDVGGGRGTLLSELLLRNPRLSGVLCDSAGVIESARELLAERGVLERVELRAGSFFDAVPEGCDAYLMKKILHDWDDATSQKILAVVRRAMKPGAKLLLCEALVEHTARDTLGTFADLQMMIACSGGRERSRAEFARLLGASGFRQTRLFAYPTIAVIEAIAE